MFFFLDDYFLICRTECFCGSDEPPNTAKLPDSSCNMKCPRDPHLTCGGYFTINVYQTGVRSIHFVNFI